MEELLTYSQTDHPVQIECELNLKAIYPNSHARNAFEKRLNNFLCADKENCTVYELEGDRLRYRTEHLIPSKKVDRTPLLLIFGNPASHSITSGMFFSPKKDGEENRFWGHLLGGVGISGLAFDKGISTSERNKRRLKRLVDVAYKAEFKIGFSVYISMPSSAGGPWGGVAGVRKLLGKRAFDLVAKEESERVLNEATRFLQPKGIGVAFQKDAWNGLSSGRNYKLKSAKAGTLKDTFKGLPEVPIFCVPPTRLLGPSRDILRKVLQRELP